MSTPEGSFRTAPPFRQTSSAKAPPLVTAHTCSMPGLLASRTGAAAFTSQMMKQALQSQCMIGKSSVMGYAERTHVVALLDRLDFGAHFSDDARDL